LKAHDDDISDVKKAEYLGDILNQEGTIDDTIKSRKDKSIGKTSQIISILSSIGFGMFYMDIALMLRDSMLINGILTNSEVWYNMKEEHLRILEAADEDLMRQTLKAHSKTALEVFYLETGKIPIRFIISKRRLMYLWQILRLDEEELHKKVYNVQKLKTTKGDWYEMIESEKEKYQINLTDEEIVHMSINRLKNLVDKKINLCTFQYLKRKVESHSKSMNILNEAKDNKMNKRKQYLKENMIHK
jgi:hypothetical protein